MDGMELVPSLLFDGTEGLKVTLSPEGDALITTTDPHGAQLVPERAVALCFELLGTYAPALLEVIEREVRSQRLRLVNGGGPEDAA